jgi:CRP-like cAMP-binding protein
MTVAHTETVSAEPQNTLLMLLPPKSRRALPPLEEVMLKAGTVLYEPDEEIEYVFFPDDALISIQSLGPDGSTLEICMVGREGMVGVQAILGGRTPYRALVQTGGRAFRMRCGRLNEGGNNANKAFQTLLLKYTNVFLVQVAQSSLCNCYHPLQERICRWLLMASDATGAMTLQVTHDTIAQLLGTRRASVTGTVGLLQKAGLIRVSRGQITIIDPSGLREMCCECYLILKDGVRQLATTLG